MLNAPYNTQHTTTFYIHFSQSHLLQLILYMVLGEFSYAAFSDCYVWNFKYFNGVQCTTPCTVRHPYSIWNVIKLNLCYTILYNCGVVWCGKAASSIHRQIKVVQKKGWSLLLVCDTKMKERRTQRNILKKMSILFLVIWMKTKTNSRPDQKLTKVDKCCSTLFNSVAEN